MNVSLTPVSLERNKSKEASEGLNMGKTRSDEPLTGKQDEGLSAPSSDVPDIEAMIRSGFVRKVYAILTVQLVLTFGLVFLFSGYAPVKTWIQLSAKSCDFGDGDEPCCGSRPVSVAAQIRADCTATVKTTPGASATASDTALNIAKCVDSQRSNATKLTAARDVAYHQAYPRCPQYGQTPTCNVIFDSWSCGGTMMWGSYLVSLIVFCMIICCKSNARVFPRNYGLLSLFTCAEGLFLGVLCSYYHFADLISAVGITVGVVAGLTAYACNTKRDFTSSSTYIFAAGWAFFLFVIVFSFGGFHSKWFYQLFCLIGIMIFSMYLVYDTQLIIGGSHTKFQFSIDDYVFAALMIYMDIINLFIYILAMLSSGSD